jgi:hypothetical protein
MKKQGCFISFVLIVVVFSCLVCAIAGWQERWVRGSGRVVEEERAVSGFSGVHLAAMGNLYIEPGNEEALRIEAEDNLLQYFEVDVSGDTLEIKTQEMISLYPTRPVNFYLTVKELDTIVLSGSGDIKAPNLEAEQISIIISGSGDVETGRLQADEVEMKISGSGSLEVTGSKVKKQHVIINGSGDVNLSDVEADLIEVQITGSGSLDVAGGEVEQQRVVISGSGDYEAWNLTSAEAKVHLSGNGSTTLHVRDRLEVSLSGSGDVNYVGQPTVEQVVTGSGDVERIGE